MKKELSADVELIKSSGGAFEVVVDGKLVHSKKQTGNPPDEVQLIEALR